MSEAGQISFVDSILQLEEIASEQEREARFDAALHDKKFR